MQNILVLETANGAGAICRWYNGETVDVFQLEQGQQAAAHIPQLIQQHIDLSAITGIAVCNGPGSFTGIRVGLSLAQGLAFARQLPIIPISAMAALAHAHQLETVTIKAVGGGYFQQEFTLNPIIAKDEIQHVATASLTVEPPTVQMIAALIPYSKPAQRLTPLYVKPCYAKAKRV